MAAMANPAGYASRNRRDRRRRRASSEDEIITLQLPVEDSASGPATGVAAVPSVASVAGAGQVAEAKARTSAISTLSLVLGVAALLVVWTGVLAAPGVALGLIAALIGAAGLPATIRPHVTGRNLALFGIASGLGAAIIGSLALTDTVTWLSADQNEVAVVREWLEARVPWLFVAF